jgi:hypothetical protein
MSQLQYTSDSLPTPEQFRQQLREANEHYDALDTLLSLQRELIVLETKYGTTSEVAYQRYQAGEAGDDIELMWWVGRYRQYMQLKTALTTSLQLVVSSPSAELIPL